MASGLPFICHASTADIIEPQQVQGTATAAAIMPLLVPAKAAVTAAIDDLCTMMIFHQVLGISDDAAIHPLAATVLHRNIGPNGCAVEVDDRA